MTADDLIWGTIALAVVWLLFLVLDHRERRP